MESAESDEAGKSKRLRSFGLAASVLVLLVWAGFTLEARMLAPRMAFYTERRAMVEWDHRTEQGGIVHVRVVRADYRTEEEYLAAIQSMLTLFPPNVPGEEEGGS